MKASQASRWAWSEGNSCYTLSSVALRGEIARLSVRLGRAGAALVSAEAPGAALPHPEEARARPVRPGDLPRDLRQRVAALALVFEAASVTSTVWVLPPQSRRRRVPDLSGTPG